MISIHAPREGSDPDREQRDADQVISIHAPREGSDKNPLSLAAWSAISIHAPREGSDPKGPHKTKHKGISIHAPREGSDFSSLDTLLCMPVFLSTLPARGATCRPFAHSKTA